MAHEQLKDAELPHALSEVASDLADLFQKELRLAKAEIASNIKSKFNAGIWMSVAGVLSLMAAFVLLQAIIFGLASFGLAMHWSCLIVAVVLVAIAGAFFAKARADAQRKLAPDRTIRQLQRDISTAREQLT